MSEPTSDSDNQSTLQSVDNWLTSLPLLGNEWVEFKLNSKTEKLTQINNLFGISSALFAFSSPMGTVQLPSAVISIIAAVFSLVTTRVKRKATTNADVLHIEWISFSTSFALHCAAFFTGIYLHDEVSRILSFIYHPLAVLLLLFLTMRRTVILCCCRKLTDVRLTVSEKEDRRNEMITRSRSQGSVGSSVKNVLPNNVIV